MKVKVSQIAYRHAADTRHESRIDARRLTSLACVCITRAERALENPCGGYSELHLGTISNMFHSMRSTHRNIRVMLKEGENNPGSVDCMALARMQLESLYAICLMLEGPDYVDMYMRDGWCKRYVRFLLHREETRDLPRFRELNMTGPQQLAEMRDFFGITSAHQATLDYEHLGTPLPAGMSKATLPRFPTPGQAVDKVAILKRKEMLKRLYPEYTRLCSFAHVLPEATFFKTLFDRNHKIREFISESVIKDQFQQKIAEDGFVVSFISIVQATAELVTLYPHNINLMAAAAEAWTELVDGSLLAKAIWEIRTRALLGIVV